MFAKNASPKFKARALILIIISFVTMYCSGMFGTDIINVIQNPLTEKLGCSATQAVLGWTIGGYTVIFISFLFSILVVKTGVRSYTTICFGVMVCGSLLVGAGYGMNSLLILSLGGFLLKNFAVALQIGIFQMISKWFEKTRGLILGLIGAAFALDNSTSSTGLTILYNNLGFSGTMMFAAAVMLVMGLVSVAFIRTAPEELGLTIDGLAESGEKPAESGAEPANYQSRWTLGKLLKVKESWCIMIGIGVFNMTLSAVVSQFFNSLMGMGLEMSACMSYMVIFGLFGIVMAPIFGKVVDLIGAQKAGIAAAAMYSASVLGFCLKIPVLGALGLVFFVCAPVLHPALTMHVFGAQEYQYTNRYLSIVVSLIGACGIPFMTIFMDLTGSYTMAYWVLLALNLLVLFLMLISTKTYRED